MATTGIDRGSRDEPDARSAAVGGPTSRRAVPTITIPLRHRVLALALGAIVGLAGFSGSPGATTFRVADNQVEGYPTVQALLFMGRYIKEKTGGRHALEVFHSAQLGDEATTIEQTRRGIIDLNRVNLSPLTAIVPGTNAILLPFQFRSTAHQHAVLDGPVGESVLKRFEAADLVGLTFYDSGARSLYNSVRPIKTLADLAGLRIRIQQSELMANLMSALGARPVVMPYGVVLPALELKVVDGAENNWPSYVSTGHYRPARFLTLTEHVTSPDVLFMSRRAWDTLSADDQALFREAAVTSRRYMRERWEQWEEESRRQAAVGTVIEAEFDRAAFVAASNGVRETYLADPDVRELAERINGVP